MFRWGFPGTVAAVSATSPAPSSPSSPVRAIFRAVAVTEAITWLLLLSAMFAKYVTESEPLGLREGGVPVAGMAHGVVFMAFVVISLIAWRTFGWNLKVLLGALVSAIVPFATYAFEVWADRRGLLGTRAPVTTA